MTMLVMVIAKRVGEGDNVGGGNYDDNITTKKIIDGNVKLICTSCILYGWGKKSDRILIANMVGSIAFCPVILAYVI